MNILLGLTFANVHSSTVGLYMDTPERTIKPALRTNMYVVPGRSGSLDYGNDTYDNIEITCKLAYRADQSSAMRAKQRAVAEFLAASGPLIFDDEPDKAYQAKVVNSVSMEELARTGTVEVTFLCQPYAESINYQQISEMQQVLPVSLYPALQGTRECPCIIRIHADTDISQLVITRTRLN